MTGILNTRTLSTTYQRITRVCLQVVDGPDKGLRLPFDTDPSGTRTITGGRNPGNRMVLADEHVSDYHFELVLQERGVLLRDRHSRNGVYVWGSRVEGIWLKPGMVFQVGHTTLELVSAEPHAVELSPLDHIDDIYGQSEIMRELFVWIERLAVRGDKVRTIIQGETGTGKELVARALHRRSPRANKPFVAINCANLRPELANDTLFGHERGAFTDAHKASGGCFEQADGGILFLDEIAELSLEIQPKLLRVLQEGKVTRQGEFKERSIDVRVLCASHQDLHVMAQNRLFREDLLHRLSGPIIRLPPLRERGDDVLFLAEHFIRTFADHGQPPLRLSNEAKELLITHSWPGNVRELSTVIRTACVMVDGEEIKRRDLSIAQSFGHSRGAIADDMLHLPYKESLARFRKIYFDRLHQLHGGSLSKISRAAKITVEGVRQALLRLGLRET